MPLPIGGPVYEWMIAASAGVDGPVIPGVLRCVDPNGAALTLDAFDDGDGWRVRLAADRPGHWRWRTADGEEGVIEVAATAADDRWPRGPLRLAADRRTLARADGAPFFFFADTAWAIVWKGTLDQWRVYLDRRVAQGFTVLQVNLLPWRWPLTDVEDNRPFHNGDPDRPNAAYFRRYDAFLGLAAERGLHVCLMLIWGGPRPTLPAVNFSPEQAVRFARYALARFGAFPMLWSLSGDAEYLQELAKWEAVGDLVEAVDPYHRPTTNHLPPSMNWHWLHHRSAWHDFHMLQTGHRRASLADIAALPAAYHRHQPVKAVVNGEPWYENHPARDRAEYGPNFSAYDARYAFWTSLLSGATMGHTYGAQGIWNWKRPGDDEAELAGPQIGSVWSAALDYAGATHCALGMAYLVQLPWWRLQPAPERVELDPPASALGRPSCAIAPDQVWLVYLPGGGGQAILKGLPAAGWQAGWFDPRRGEEQPIGLAEPGPDLRWRTPPPPTAEDWVLILTRP